jgi:two-component system nitrogen regulation response regulator GlnG
VSTQADIWVVDDDEAIRFVLQRALTRRGYDVECFGTVGAVGEALRDGYPRAIITDIRLPDADGLSVVDMLIRQSIEIPVIAMTAYSDLDQAVSAFQKGVFEYLPKPFDLDQVISVVDRAVANKDSRPQRQAKSGGSRLLGESPAMQEVFRTIGRLSRNGQRQGGGGAGSASAQPSRQRALRCHQHRGDPRRAAGVRTVRP